MGSGDSKEDDNNSTNNNDGDAVSVILHVYQPGGDEQSPIGMVYHSGVEVYGSEYYYGGGSSSGTGIAVQKPKSQPRGSKWEYYQSHIICKNINKSRQQVREIIAELRQDWKAKDYHLTKNNCNHFSDTFVKALCGDNYSIPGWVNRLARAGNMLSGLLSNDNQKKLDKQLSGKGQQQSEMMKNPEFAAEYGKKHGPQPMIEYVPDTKTIFLLDYLKLNECGALNLCEQQDTDDLSKLFTQDLNNMDNCIAVKSENDEQLLLFIPFKTRVKLEAIGLALPFGQSCPKTIKLFSGKKNMDFDDAETMEPTKTIKIKKPKNKDNNNKEEEDEEEEAEEDDNSFWAKSYPLKLTKFRNINYLTIFVQDNYGDDISKLFKIELWGQDK